MSHFNTGLLSGYNSLTDKHLAGYFSNTRIRRHLQRAGLITRSGRIVPDKEYRHKLIQRAHQRHVRECLAQAIFHKVLEMERVHQIEIKRKLEEFARRERVHKIKVERSKRYEEDIIRILSPRPPTGARAFRKQHSGPEGEHSESSESPGSSRPNTAPGKMQRPVRLKPIHSNSTTASLRRRSPYRLRDSSNDNDRLFNSTMDKESRKRLTTMEASHGISPYCLPVINNFVTPVPPATKRRERGVKVTPSSTLRGRRLRPTTASSGADVNEETPMLRSSVHQTRVCVNMVYFGKAVHLSHDLSDMRDEVKVFQQHCGGENLCVYKGHLSEGETFQFISRRHRGFPFSLTFFLNGLQVERLSSCCEFKHRKCSRLGGRHGHFGFMSVEGASPCYKCIIAMGLDKKPTPPPKRIKEDGGREESSVSPKEAPQTETGRTREEPEPSPPQETEAEIKEETAAEEDRARDDYEEDFEADDEGPAEEDGVKEKKSPSPSGEPERKVKEGDASETEDERDEVNSSSGSSSSGSDREESDAEAPKDSREDEKTEPPEELHQEETTLPTVENEEQHPEEVAETEPESSAPKDSDIQNSAGESTEIDISDNSVNKQSDDNSGEKDVKTTVESKQEEEPERAKSVQEKLADAILKESQRSSEPELSDTSTEEEEESTDKGPEQDNKDAALEKSVTITEEQQTVVEETNYEEGVAGEDEVVPQVQEETSQAKGEEDELEQDPKENDDSTKEEVKIREGDEKAASDEDKEIAANDGTEDAQVTALPHAAEEEIVDKAPEPQEDSARSTEAAEKDQEKQETTATVADEMGHGAKSREEDESSVPESNKKADETVAPDSAEAMTASETMEMKAEPSEEREALNCEEAPVGDTEERQQGGSQDGDAGTEKEIEDLVSVLEGNQDPTVEETAEAINVNEEDERNKDDVKGEEAVEGSKDDSQQEKGDEEDEAGKTVEIVDEVGEKSGEEGEKEEKLKNPDEIAEETDADKTEEEETSESRMEERIEKVEGMLELTESNSRTEVKEDEEQERESHGEEDEVPNENKEQKSEEKEEDAKGDIKPEEKGQTIEKMDEDEKMFKTNTAADEEKDDNAGKEEEDQSEKKAEPSEAAGSKDEEESDRKIVDTDKIGEEGKMSEIAEEPEKSVEAHSDENNVETSDDNIVKSKDVGENESANVAHETKMTEETINVKVEAEDIKTETENGGDQGEKGEIDAENGEISIGAENKSEKAEGETQTEVGNEVKTADGTEDEINTEDPTENKGTQAKETTGESENGEGNQDNKVDGAPESDVADSDAKEDNVGEPHESAGKDSEVKISGVEETQESKSDKGNNEKTNPEENLRSEPENENRDLDSTQIKNSIQAEVSEVVVMSSCDQVQSSKPMVEDSDDTARKLDSGVQILESNSPDSKTETPKLEGANETVTALDPCTADGENGDAEEASKASEEGASVLLKPQASQLTQHKEADTPVESNPVDKDTPEALETEDNTDMVTNWVTMHQTSHFFETFIEPLEDLRELPSVSKENGTRSVELPRSSSPVKMAKLSETTDQERVPKDVDKSMNEPKEEVAELDLESKGDPAKDMGQVQEETEVKEFSPETEIEQVDEDCVNERNEKTEETKGSKGSLREDEVQEDTEKADVPKTEVESIVGTQFSVTSGRREESVSKNQTEEETTDEGPDLHKTQSVEMVKDLQPLTKTELQHDNSTNPEELSTAEANKLEEQEETPEKLTEITNFRSSRSDDGSQGESNHKDPQPKPSDMSINGDRRDLIQDIAHTLSKDRMSSFSVDESLFGRASYPLLTTTRTENGH